MKYFKYCLLLIFLFPFMVSAEPFEYEIVVDVAVENKDIEENEFTFNLIDVEGNVIQTKKNDGNGKVTFDPIAFEASEVDTAGGFSDYITKDKDYGYRFYIVQQVIEDEDLYIYDKDEAYIGVYFFADGTSEVNYLKDIDKTIEEWTYRANRDESKIFHATEEDLQGQAYAFFEYSTNSLIFFRDEENKYTDKQYVSEGVYYTNFENSETSYTPWSGYTLKKIIFNDPIKPMNIKGWFSNKFYLEKIENINLLDTSLITSFERLFEYDRQLKELDLSTWDTSNVTNMYGMFYNCSSLEDVNIDNFDTSKVTNYRFMFSYSAVKNVDVSLLDVTNVTDSVGGEQVFYTVDNIRGLDFSSWNNDVINAGMLASYSQDLRFLDVSTLKRIGSQGVACNPKLTIVRLNGRYEYLNTSVGSHLFKWFNINNRTMYTAGTLNNHLQTLKDLEPATYVRPDGNIVPSVFNNKYIKTDVEGEGHNLINPETGDKIIIILAIMIVSVIIYKLLNIIKTKKNINN